jgi:hypothetical protein
MDRSRTREGGRGYDRLGRDVGGSGCKRCFGILGEEVVEEVTEVKAEFLEQLQNS